MRVRRAQLSAALAVCTIVFLARRWRRGAAPWRRRETLQARQHPISNKKSTTFRNGTTEEGWFYPTPAALKAAADVRGARAAREFFRPSRSDVPRAGNAEAYYPHFQFDSNYTYGMVHRE